MMIPSAQPKRNSIVMRVLLFVCGFGIFVGVSHITSLSTEKDAQLRLWFSPLSRSTIFLQRCGELRNLS